MPVQQGRKKPAPSSRNKSAPATPSSRAGLVFIGSTALLAVAALGQVRANLFPDSRARSKGEGLALSAPTSASERGIFTSGDGKILARSQDSWLLQVSYHKLNTSPDFFIDLSQVTGVNPQELKIGLDDYAELKRGSADATLIREWDVLLNTQQKDAAQKVYDHWAKDGVGFVRNKARIYPFGDPFVDVLGLATPEEFKNQRARDVKGRTGLELTLNQFLSTAKGLPDPDAERGARINGLTQERKKLIEERLAKNPSDRFVELTLDTDLQRASFEAVRKAVISSGAEAGVGIILDAATGDLLAAADYPVGQKGIRENSPSISRYAVTDVAYEPGSTMKLITLAKAISDGKVTPGETFMSASSLSIPGSKPIRNHGGKAFGVVTADQAIAHSCNVTAAKWALRIGSESFYSFLRETGVVANRPGLGSEGEAKGLFSFGASPRDLASLGFGQGINLPPATLAGMFGMLANGGEFVAPRLLKTIAGVELPAERRGFFLSPEACRIALKASEAVIEEPYGTGAKLKIPGLLLGGKTGTAQIIQGGKVQGYRANFVGFAPMPQPRYVILAMIDRPRGADFYGGSIAGPVYVAMVKAMVEKGMIKDTTLARAVPTPVARPLPPGPVHLKALPTAPTPSPRAVPAPSRRTEARESESRPASPRAGATPRASTLRRAREASSSSSTSSRRTRVTADAPRASSARRASTRPRTSSSLRSASSLRSVARPRSERTSSSLRERSRTGQSQSSERRRTTTRRSVEGGRASATPRKTSTTRRTTRPTSSNLRSEGERTTARRSSSSRRVDSARSESARRSSRQTQTRKSEGQAASRPSTRSTSSRRRVESTSSAPRRTSTERTSRRTSERESRPSASTRRTTEASRTPRSSARQHSERAESASTRRRTSSSSPASSRRRAGDETARSRSSAASRRTTSAERRASSTTRARSSSSRKEPSSSTRKPSNTRSTRSDSR
jgi:cell division protein FtsI (penicillin-binding protein 3)